jgi:cbb3-type cytochrome c oxidase subunit III
MKSRTWWFGLGILIVTLVAILTMALSRHAFSARKRPSALEASIARRLRRFSIPSAATHQSNPYHSTPELLKEARHHFADHCANCHANDGSGNTELGQKMYPQAPDMRLAATQQLTDGELYYIIHNGIRWTGMPAWGGSGEDDDSWKLLVFIATFRDYPARKFTTWRTLMRRAKPTSKRKGKNRSF